MTTLAQALVAVRERLNETTAVAWADAELRRWIMEGVNDLARATESLQDRIEITLTAGTSTYTLPANVIRVHRCEYEQGTSGGAIPRYPLDIVEYEAGDALWYSQRAVTQSRPEAVAFWGFPPNLKMEVYPKPPTTNHKIEVFYYRFQTVPAFDGSADSTTLEIPTGWEDLVYDYATSMAFRRDRNETWKDVRSLYQQKLQDMIGMTTHWHDQPGTVTGDIGPLGGFLGEMFDGWY